MVLTDLSRQLTAAISKLNSKAGLDNEAIKAVVLDIQRALLDADVNTKLVAKVGHGRQRFAGRAAGGACRQLLFSSRVLTFRARRWARISRPRP